MVKNWLRFRGEIHRAFARVCAKAHIHKRGVAAFSQKSRAVTHSSARPHGISLGPCHPRF